MYIKKLYNIPYAGPHGQGQKWKNTPTFQQINIPTGGSKTKCMSMMSMKPIVKFIAPGSGGLGNRKGPIWAYFENLSDLRKSSSLSLHIVKKKYMSRMFWIWENRVFYSLLSHMLILHINIYIVYVCETFHLTCESHGPWSGVHVLKGDGRKGTKWP